MPTDPILGAGAAIFAALLTAVLSVYRIVKAQESSRMALALSAQETRKQPFFVKQFEASLRASKTASTLATTNDLALFRESLNEFWLLYYGELAVVESPELASAMVKFGDELDKLTDPPVLPASGLRDFSLEIADSVRLQTQSNWYVKLPPLTELKTSDELNRDLRRIS